MYTVSYHNRKTKYSTVGENWEVKTNTGQYRMEENFPTRDKYDMRPWMEEREIKLCKEK